MKVFTQHVGSLLTERAESLEQEDHNGWRCIYMQMHDKQERFNAMLRVNFINRAVVDLLAKDDGYIYFCNDGDIIILFEGALKPVVARLGSHFGDLNPDQLRGGDADNLFSFFDLSKHWEGFAELCREKAARTVSPRNRLPHIALALESQRGQQVNA